MTSRRLWATLIAMVLVTAGGLSACGLVGGERSEFCGLLEAALPAYRTDPLEPLPPDSGAVEWKAHFDVSHQRNQKLITAAPSELVTALTDLQTANDQLAAFYAEAEYDPAQIDTGALSQLLNDTGYARSVAAVTTYAKNTCQI
jgi:hypothetical protein